MHKLRRNLLRQSLVMYGPLFLMCEPLVDHAPRPSKSIPSAKALVFLTPSTQACASLYDQKMAQHWWSQVEQLQGTDRLVKTDWSRNAPDQWNTGTSS